MLPGSVPLFYITVLTKVSLTIESYQIRGTPAKRLKYSKNTTRRSDASLSFATWLQALFLRTSRSLGNRETQLRTRASTNPKITTNTVVRSHARQAALKLCMTKSIISCAFDQPELAASTVTAPASKANRPLMPNLSANRIKNGMAASCTGANMRLMAALMVESTAEGILLKIGRRRTKMRHLPRQSMVQPGAGNKPVCRPRQMVAALSLCERLRMGAEMLIWNQSRTTTNTARGERTWECPAFSFSVSSRRLCPPACRSCERDCDRPRADATEGAMP